MTLLISQICALQKTYGKNQAEIETLADGFCWILTDYDIDEIRAAMRDYILTKSDIPAPADILSIIKEKRERNRIKHPNLATLRHYQERGIKLTPAQEKIINDNIGVRTNERIVL
jgi:hypothetical protein